MKTVLDKAYFWANKTYLPGEEIEIPDELAAALGLTEKTQPPQEEPPLISDPAGKDATPEDAADPPPTEDKPPPSSKPKSK